VSDPRLFEAAARWCKDPLTFVQKNYPWGEGELSRFDGPDIWQADVLACIRDNLSRTAPLKIAVAGGVGPGKSTLASWVIDWAMSTCTDTRIVITANTGSQLSSKTLPEVFKWHRMSLFNSWFEAGSRVIRSLDPKRKETWRCDAVTWDESNPEGFAGLHNAGRRIVLIMDESSAIPDTIWEVAEQALTDADTEIIWLVLGNPTRNTGRFRQCFPGGAQQALWHHYKIDTRRAKMTNKAQIQEWIDHYGIDSDFVRVRVLSEFPRAGDSQFIGMDLIQEATQREASGTLYDPLIIGVDPARFGDDEFRISFRRGLDARTIPSLGFRGLDNMQGAARIAELNERYKPDAIFIDDGGQGAGVLDRCRYLHLPVTGVTFGGKPDRGQVGQGGAISYANKRAEIWGLMKEWLRHGAIENAPQLVADLSAVEYGYKMVDGRDAIILERKEDMKKRGLSSPDWGDSLAITFAFPVGQSDHTHILGRHRQRHEYDYNPMSELYKVQR
jgi:hypothetical protein